MKKQRRNLHRLSRRSNQHQGQQSVTAQVYKLWPQTEYLAVLKKGRRYSQRYGFFGDTAGPCQSHRKANKLRVYLGLHTHNNLLIWDLSDMKETIKDLKEYGLVMKTDSNLNNDM